MTDDRKSRAMNSMGVNHLTADELAKVAGVHVDRENLGGEYPKMLYRLGENPDHHLNSEPTTLAGIADVQTLVVEDETEELEALEAGWVRKTSELITEIPEMTRRGPGRPKINADA